MSNDEDYLRNI